MKILIACECSGRVRDEFRKRGHDAFSCDIKPCERGERDFHYTGNVRDLLKGNEWKQWDLMIAHPPCTYVCTMGVWWNHRRPERIPLTKSAIRFVLYLASRPIPRIAIENPKGVLSSRWRRPDQVIHPWQHGHSENKPTCLWLKGLPLLSPSHLVPKGDFYTGKSGMRYSKNLVRLSGLNPQSAVDKSRTYLGIARAMASQWSKINP